MKTQCLAFCAVYSMLLAGCGPPSPESADGEETPAAVTVHAVEARIGVIQPTLELAGTLIAIPEKTVVLSSQAAGQVKHVDVHEGQSINQGDIIAILDTRTHEAELAKADAALDEARAGMSLLEHGPLPQEIEMARQQGENAATAADAQRIKFQALESLHKTGEISDVQLQQAKAAKDGTEAASQAARQQLNMLQAGTRKETLEEAKAKLAGAQAEVAARQLAIEQCTIRSPINGVITELTVREGMYVDQPVVLGRIVDQSALFARVRIPAKYRGQVHEGARALIKATCLGNRQVEANLERLGKEADAQSGDTEGFVRVENNEQLLLPGIACAVTILLPEIKDALVVPVAAVADRNGAAIVTVIRDNRAFETKTEIGIRTPDLVQVLAGLAPGDIVATEGGYGLPDNCPVEIVPDN